MYWSFSEAGQLLNREKKIKRSAVRGNVMRDKAIYFIFTDTGTYLSRVINYFTNQSLNHVSIAMDADLREVYSFGRIQPQNPFSGGFVREDVRGKFLKNARCAVYKFYFSEAELEQIMTRIKQIEAEKCHYKYNFIGLIGILFNIEINRKHAFFCSQFVAWVLRDLRTFHVEKPICFTTPSDIRSHAGMQLIYQGILKDYEDATAVQLKPLAEVTNPVLAKPSMFFTLSKKVKQFVIR